MNNIEVSDSIRDVFPEFNALSFRVEVDPSRVLTVAIEEIEEIDQLYRARAEEWGMANPSDIPEVKLWRQAIRSFPTPSGACSSIESLIRRIRSGKFPPRIHPLIDLGNLISAQFAIPVGCEDLDRSRPFTDSVYRVGPATGLEIANPLGRPEIVEYPLAGEWIYSDALGVVCRALNWRECNRTAVDRGSRNVLFATEILSEKEISNSEKAFGELKRILIERFNAKVGAFQWAFHT